MANRWSVRSLAAAGAAAVALSGLAGCAPPSSPPGLTNPPAACYDNTDNAFRPDYYYTGAPNIRNNMKAATTTNGSCADRAPALDATLVLAADATAAGTICESLGGNASLTTFYVQGWRDLPLTAYLCTFT